MINIKGQIIKDFNYKNVLIIFKKLNEVYCY